MNKLKIYKIIWFCLIIAITIIATLIIVKNIKSGINENNLKNIVTQIYNDENIIKEENLVLPEENLTSLEEIDAEIEGNKVVGIIKIPKIDIEYPILETTTVDTLNLSITKFWGNKINEVGNIALAGHNRLNGTMFGKTKKLEIGDEIELTDLQKVTLKYKIYKKYVTDPNDISCIAIENQGAREITLITCTNGNKNRLIIKAVEI